MHRRQTKKTGRRAARVRMRSARRAPGTHAKRLRTIRTLVASRCARRDRRQRLCSPREYRRSALIGDHSVRYTAEASVRSKEGALGTNLPSRVAGPRPNEPEPEGKAIRREWTPTVNP